MVKKRDEEMEYDYESHRNAITILENDPKLKKDWQQVQYIINSITEGDIMKVHNENFCKSNKSISLALNKLFHERFKDWKWQDESPIFQDEEYQGEKWRLDFAKKGTLSIEVAYNHGGTIAWNLLKPVLASELNHVKKQAQTKIGIIITATRELQKVGGFDNAVGLYDNYVKYLKPLMNQLTVPLLIIGLHPPKYFKIVHRQFIKNDGKRIKVGKVVFKGAKKKLSKRFRAGNYIGRIYFRKKYKLIRKGNIGSYYKGKIK